MSRNKRKKLAKVANANYNTCSKGAPSSNHHLIAQERDGISHAIPVKLSKLNTSRVDFLRVI